MYTRIFALMICIVLVSTLMSCTSSGDKYWGQVAGGVGETVKR